MLRECLYYSEKSKLGKKLQRTCLWEKLQICVVSILFWTSPKGLLWGLSITTIIFCAFLVLIYKHLYSIYAFVFMYVYKMIHSVWLMSPITPHIYQKIHQPLRSNSKRSCFLLNYLARSHDFKLQNLKYFYTHFWRPLLACRFCCPSKLKGSRNLLIFHYYYNKSIKLMV